jgi:hypothetical protein
MLRHSELIRRLPSRWPAALRVGLICVLATPCAFAAETDLQVLDAARHHLGVAGEPEWRELAGKVPEARSLEIKFKARPNPRPATLFIGQREVKLRWPVLLNGQRLGWLELRESPLVSTFVVPAGALREGENSLSIIAPEVADDIEIDGITLDRRPLESALGDATVRVRVTEKSGGSLPCRITIADAHGRLAPLVPKPGQALAARTGVIYSGDGAAEIGLAPGAYTIYATRGFEYGMAQRTISLAAGQSVDVALQIAREVETPGLVACDTHIHTLALSGHGDATVEERVLTLAGEGWPSPRSTTGSPITPASRAR